MPITPDTKNWTWVLERPCPECGFDSSDVRLADVPRILRENTAAWPEVLLRPDVRERPNDSTWSPLEYAAHVRDVFRTFDARLAAMLSDTNPEFENWDQDATALAERYNEQDPAFVSAELVSAGHQLADAFEAVPRDAVERTGRRSDGAVFTITTLGQYLVHDPIHHLWDVTVSKA
ncbi:DinB family protein [Mycetocola zhadangensis]|uniref:DinB family protein n=1 Tax=Mycetocola zhadangensis TaxID=1164595 RepID=UPI003A4D8492